MRASVLTRGEPCPLSPSGVAGPPRPADPRAFDSAQADRSWRPGWSRLPTSGRLPGACVLVLGLVSACSLYSPSITDCSLTCGSDGRCPTGSECRFGFCRPPGATGSCDCHPGNTRACGGDAGVCVPGVQQCGTDGTWLAACRGEGLPSAEICDGLDNDCNGKVDDNPRDAKACPLTLGVCASAHQGCDAGVQVTCVDASYGPTYQPLEHTCDGLDNDCDGEADLSRKAVLATDETRAWMWVGSDAGFALVYERVSADGGAAVVVRRFDGRFAPRGGDVIVDRGPAPDLWASALGDDVFVAWQTTGKLSAARVDPAGGVTRFVDPGAAIGAGPIRAGVGERFVAAAYTPSYAGLEAVAWELDGGLFARRFIDPVDAGLSIDGVYGFAVSERGRYLVYTYYQADGGATVRPLVRVDDGGVVTSIDYYGGTSAQLVETATGLSATYGYSDAVLGTSGCYFLADVVTHVPEVTVKENGSSAQAIWCRAAGDGLGGTMLAVQDGVQNATGLARADAGSNAFARRDLAPGSGTGDPRVAIGPDGMPGLAWLEGTTISARRVCW